MGFAMDLASTFITPGIIFLLTLVFGVWLSQSGKPYNGILFNIHKLMALGAVIATAIQIYRAPINTEIQALLVALIILTGLCVLALFVTGALMSMGKPAYDTLLTTHRVAPVLAVIAMAATVYLLNTGNSYLGQ
jgi:hypothetical protein